MHKLVLTLFFSLNYFYGAAQEAQLIKRYHSGKLSWNDFRGEISYTDSMHVAAIYAKIHITNEPAAIGSGTYFAEAVVVKQGCWMYENLADEQALEHAQLHFDLTQLVAKEIEHELNARKFSLNSTRRYNNVVQKFNYRLSMLHQQYDKETAFGSDNLKQQEWKAQIESKINKSYISRKEDIGN